MSRAINSGKISSRVFLGVDSTDPKSETKVPQAKYFYLQGGRRINLEPFKYGVPIVAHIHIVRISQAMSYCKRDVWRGSGERNWSAGASRAMKVDRGG